MWAGSLMIRLPLLVRGRVHCRFLPCSMSLWVAALVPAELKFDQGENVVEIYVVEATLAKLTSQDTTFALIDFFEFESQSSPLATGSHAIIATDPLVLVI